MLDGGWRFGGMGPGGAEAVTGTANFDYFQDIIELFEKHHFNLAMWMV